jgi:hypothetical protein
VRQLIQLRCAVSLSYMQGKATLIGLMLLGQLSAASSVNVLSFGASGNGVADDSFAIQSALDSGISVYLPSGTYRACDLRIKQSGTRIYGDSQSSTIIVCSTGTAFRNYANPDGGAAKLNVDTFQDVSFEHLTFQGGADIVSDYLSSSGLSKPLANQSRNVGIRWKQSVRNSVRNCVFRGFERGMQVDSGFGNTWEQNQFLGNQIGMYYDTGWTYGDPVYKVTTNNSHRNQFSNNWVGVFSVALVDNSVFLGDIFEMNNTALYLGNSSLVRINAYFERNWEGAVFAGIYSGANYIQNSDFVGSLGEGNWGSGFYIHILPGTPSAAEVHLMGIPFFNSGTNRGAGVLAAGGRILFENPSLLQSYSFATLPPAGSASPGTTWMVYCPDCRKGISCAPGGTGALAKYLGGAWDCN